MDESSGKISGLTVLGNWAAGICLSGIRKMLNIQQWSETRK